MKYSSVIILTLFVLFIIGCNIPSPEVDETIVEPIQNVINPNALVIKEKCAVILELSSAEIDSIRAATTEDVFAEIASDIGFYNATAKEDLTEKGIKVIRTDKEEVIFIQSNGEQTSILRKPYQFDLIFFSPEQKPIGTYTADFNKDLSYLGIKDGNEFTEGYWVGLKALDSAGKDHIFRYFYKTSYINDEPLLQVFDNGEIKVEEILILQEDNGTYKQANEDIFYEFNNGKDITITQAGYVGGLIGVPENRIKE